MGFYKIADRIFEIRERYDYIKDYCSAYAVDSCSADYIIEASDSEIEHHRRTLEDMGEMQKPSPQYAETLAVYKQITECLFREGCFLLHAAVITFDGKAYAFTAPSGTGKTTHIKLWKKCFGDRVDIVNGDKPLIRRVNENGKDRFIAYGTPWSGKEKYQKNVKAELCGICIVNRGERNEIFRVSTAQAVPELYRQMMRFSNAEYLNALLDMIDGMVSNIPVYLLRCNMDDEAAVCACRAMTGADV